LLFLPNYLIRNEKNLPKERDSSTDNCHDKKNSRCTKQKENDRKETAGPCVIKCLIEHDDSLSGRRQHEGRMNSRT